MTAPARRTWTDGSTFTDDNDGALREWDADTHHLIRTLRAPNTPSRVAR